MDADSDKMHDSFIGIKPDIHWLKEQLTNAHPPAFFIEFHRGHFKISL
jgi:hypothetical protein